MPEGSTSGACPAPPDERPIFEQMADCTGHLSLEEMSASKEGSRRKSSTSTVFLDPADLAEVLGGAANSGMPDVDEEGMPDVTELPRGDSEKRDDLLAHFSDYEIFDLCANMAMKAHQAEVQGGTDSDTEVGQTLPQVFKERQPPRDDALASMLDGANNRPVSAAGVAPLASKKKGGSPANSFRSWPKGPRERATSCPDSPIVKRRGEGAPTPPKRRKSSGALASTQSPLNPSCSPSTFAALNIGGSGRSSPLSEDTYLSEPFTLDGGVERAVSGGSFSSAHSANISAPDSPAGGNNSRKNKLQRCSLCGQLGHKSRTCEKAPAQSGGGLARLSRASSLNSIADLQEKAELPPTAESASSSASSSTSLLQPRQRQGHASSSSAAAVASSASSSSSARRWGRQTTAQPKLEPQEHPPPHEQPHQTEIGGPDNMVVESTTPLPPPSPLPPPKLHEQPPPVPVPVPVPASSAAASTLAARSRGQPPQPQPQPQLHALQPLSVSIAQPPLASTILPEMLVPASSPRAVAPQAQAIVNLPAGAVLQQAALGGGAAAESAALSAQYPQLQLQQLQLAHYHQLHLHQQLHQLHQLHRRAQPTHAAVGQQQQHAEQQQQEQQQRQRRRRKEKKKAADEQPQHLQPQPQPQPQQPPPQHMLQLQQPAAGLMVAQCADGIAAAPPPSPIAHAPSPSPMLGPNRVVAKKVVASPVVAMCVGPTTCTSSASASSSSASSSAAPSLHVATMHAVLSVSAAPPSGSALSPTATSLAPRVSSPLARMPARPTPSASVTSTEGPAASVTAAAGAGEPVASSEVLAESVERITSEARAVVASAALALQRP